jgi:hypothetical protein
MANIKERGILSKTFGVVVGAYMLVGAGCGAWAEVDGWNDGDTPGADFGRGAVYGAKQLISALKPELLLFRQPMKQGVSRGTRHSIINPSLHYSSRFFLVATLMWQPFLKDSVCK